MTELTAERLRQVLSYDPETGGWTWLETLSRRRMAGSAAGDLKPSGYFCIGVFGKRYRAHRLAWLYVTGQWPRQQIDHIDGDPGNNRWANLREASPAQNAFNRGANRNNSIGFKGVHRCRNPGGSISWHAKINIGKRQIHLGAFRTPEEAHRAYATAAAELVGEYAHA